MATELEVRVNVLEDIRSRNWQRFSNFYSPALQTLDGACSIAERILGRGRFIDDTLSVMDPNYKGRVSYVDALMIQQGHRAMVFRVEVNEHQFAFILSGGTNFQNEEVRQDFGNMRMLRGSLEERRLRLFVPQTYEIIDHDGIYGMSMEFLTDHVEMNARPAPGLTEIKIPFAEFVMMPTAEKAVEFNNLQHSNAQRLLLEAARNVSHLAKGGVIPEEVLRKSVLDLLPGSAYYKINQGGKEELSAMFYVIFQITGSVPWQFLVNAGDTMADPRKKDLDLRIITLKGLRRIRNERQFINWLYYHTEEVIHPDPKIGRIRFYLFDGDETVIRAGIQKGKQMLS